MHVLSGGELERLKGLGSLGSLGSLGWLTVFVSVSAVMFLGIHGAGGALHVVTCSQEAWKSWSSLAAKTIGWVVSNPTPKLSTSNLRAQVGETRSSFRSLRM